MPSTQASYAFDTITGKSLIRPYYLAANERGDVFVANYSDGILVKIPAGSLTPESEGTPDGATPNESIWRAAVDSASSDVMIVTFDAVYRVAEFRLRAQADPICSSRSPTSCSVGRFGMSVAPMATSCVFPAAPTRQTPPRS